MIWLWGKSYDSLIYPESFIDLKKQISLCFLFINNTKKFMLKIITNIPLFFWLLFVVLLIAGLKARKTSLVPLKIHMLIPAAVGSLFFGKYFVSDYDSLMVVLWLLCLGLGFFIGFSHMKRLKIGFDRQKMMVEMPGSSVPLMLSMSVFFAKFSIGMMRALLPYLEGSLLFLGLELFSSVILGIFAGRAINCLLRYRTLEAI